MLVKGLIRRYTTHQKQRTTKCRKSDRKEECRMGFKGRRWTYVIRPGSTKFWPSHASLLLLLRLVWWLCWLDPLSHECPHTWMSGTNPLLTSRAWFWGTHKWAIYAALLAGGVSRTVDNVLALGPPLHRDIELSSFFKSTLLRWLFSLSHASDLNNLHIHSDPARCLAWWDQC